MFEYDEFCHCGVRILTNSATVRLGRLHALAFTPVTSMPNNSASCTVATNGVCFAFLSSEFSDLSIQTRSRTLARAHSLGARQSRPQDKRYFSSRVPQKHLQLWRARCKRSQGNTYPDESSVASCAVGCSFVWFREESQTPSKRCERRRLFTLRAVRIWRTGPVAMWASIAHRMTCKFSLPALS